MFFSVFFFPLNDLPFFYFLLTFIRKSNAVQCGIFSIKKRFIGFVLIVNGLLKFYLSYLKLSKAIIRRRQ